MRSCNPVDEGGIDSQCQVKNFGLMSNIHGQRSRIYALQLLMHFASEYVTAVTASFFWTLAHTGFPVG